MNFPRPADTIDTFWRPASALCPKCRGPLVAYFPKLSKHPVQIHCDLCGYHVEKQPPKPRHPKGQPLQTHLKPNPPT